MTINCVVWGWTGWHTVFRSAPFPSYLLRGRSIKMKKYLKVVGWIFIGIFIQFKFNALYGIVFLENLNFHDRTYIVKMQLSPTEEALRVLHVETVVHHSLGADYFANVYIPSTFKVLNRSPYTGAEAISGYHAYKMDMKRKYRDVLSAFDFIIAPADPNQEVPATPLLVHFENMKQLLHIDKTYQLTVTKRDTQLEGPELAEAVYPQKLGM